MRTRSFVRRAARRARGWLWAGAALAALAGGAPQGRGADWPRFLGPTGDGRSPETHLVDRIPEEGLPVVWTRDVGTGYSAPSVADGRVYLHHRLGNEEIVETFDAATGQPGWRHGTPTSFQDPYGYNNGPRCTPLVTSNHVIVFGAEGRLVCLRRDSGERVWQRETGKEFQVPEAFFGVGSTPLMEGDKLIVMVGGQPNSGVVAFNPATGETLWEGVGESNWSGQPMFGFPGTPKAQWRAWDKQASYASPVAATLHGERHILCLTRQGLVSLDPKDGTVRFSFWFRSRANESVNAANPVVHGDLILISAAYYKVGSVLLRVRPDGRGVEEVWRAPTLEMHWATPLLVDGKVYGFSGRDEPDASLRCVDFLTGRLLWERDESWPKRSSRQPPVYGRGSMILADGKFFALGEGGRLGILIPNPDGPEERGQWQVPGLEYPCWAAPVLADGRLYLRSEKRLVCVDARQKASGAEGM